MTPLFFSEAFFSLGSSSYKDLWCPQEPVWTALSRLDAYLCLPFHKKRPLREFPHVHFQKPESVFIAENVRIEPGVTVCGPCVIGEGCVIRQGAYLRGGVLCGSGSIIGHSCEVKHSILLEGACIAHFSYVGDSILGSQVNLGAGVKCSNLRLDRKEVFVKHKTLRIPTGLKKFGAVLGDQCQLGCNVVLNPGTLMGPGCICFPLLQLNGVIPSGQLIRNRQEVSWSPLSKNAHSPLEALEKTQTAKTSL